MSDTWAAVLAIATAVLAFVQLATLALLARVGLRFLSASQAMHKQTEALAGDIQTRAEQSASRVKEALAPLRHPLSGVKS